MTSAERVVAILIENDEDLSPQEFMQSFGTHRMLGFSYADSRLYAGARRDVPGGQLVYAKNSNGTHDFIGLIKCLPDIGGWVPVAAARVRPGQQTGYIDLYPGKPFATKHEAATDLLASYERVNKPDQQEARRKELTPGEFISGMPDLLVRYEFIPATSPGFFDVKRWEGGSYYYIGTVERAVDGAKWAPTTLAPVGDSRYTSVLKCADEDFCATPREAAQRLWGIYKAKLDQANRE